MAEDVCVKRVYTLVEIIPPPYEFEKQMLPLEGDQKFVKNCKAQFCS